MFFRFGAGLFLAVLISLVGICLEKQTLEMKRAVSRQYFQKDLLLELRARQRLRIQQLTAPSQLADAAIVPMKPSVRRPSTTEGDDEAAAGKVHTVRPVPLLRWSLPPRTIE